MKLLAIETSCDECSAAVLNGSELKSVVISSQLVHNQFGGVVPELASRAHVELIVPVVEEALRKAGESKSSIELVAVTFGPGLAGSLIVGLSFAKSFAAARRLPLIGLNHMEGHLYSTFLEKPEPQFPFVSLIVSGGHTMLILVKEPYDHILLGQTRDDAAGEAFDKVAKLLDLGYPGGPIIDRLAKEGNPKAFIFPRAFLENDSFDFSFSGIKTSVLYLLKRISYNSDLKGSQLVKDICASFQSAVVDVLVEKTLAAAKKFAVKSISVAGGVAANSELRRKFTEYGADRGMTIHFPRPLFCTDNAAMIGIAAYFKFKKVGIVNDMSLKPVPNLTLNF
ncbi:MAG: tRNA (adenosine(37)-N6)-threonylcarbamoyltransferase complex transferase subunit TsaD [Candidatus Kryptoniota bacterium]